MVEFKQYLVSLRTQRSLFVLYLLSSISYNQSVASAPSCSRLVNLAGVCMRMSVQAASPQFSSTRIPRMGKYAFERDDDICSSICDRDGRFCHGIQVHGDESAKSQDRKGGILDEGDSQFSKRAFKQTFGFTLSYIFPVLDAFLVRYAY